MKPDKRFLNQPLSFWANIRAISESVGYTERGRGIVKVPSVDQIAKAFESRGLTYRHIVCDNQKLTKFGQLLIDYFDYRAGVLNEYVEPRLMDSNRVKREFKELRSKLKPSRKCPMPMNKQKGTKRQKAYLTCMVNMIIEAYAKNNDCDYDPRALTTITKNNKPLRTFARRFDGAFPSVVNPIAVWEIKEYYHTTTFGSRVADSVYETLLDGMEIAELKEHENVEVLHYFIIDAYYTWWECGKSYLCRIIDAIHMGYITEVLFGYEVVERLPKIIKEWIKIQGRK